MMRAERGSVKGKKVLSFPLTWDQIYIEKRRAYTKFEALAPVDVPSDSLWDWFEEKFNPDREEITPQEREIALKREEAYLKRGFQMVEGRDLLGIWTPGELTDPERDEIKGLDIVNNVARKTGEIRHHLLGPRGYYIVRVEKAVDGGVSLREELRKSFRWLTLKE